MRYAGFLAVAVLVSAVCGQLVVNEIMYNSIGDDQEWIELANIVYGPVDLDSTWVLMDGEGEFNFPEVTVEGGDFLTIFIDSDLPGDSITLDFVPDVFANGHGIKLANAGDDIILLHIEDSDTFIVDSVTYSPSWGTASNGSGPTLERIDIMGGSNDPTNWGASYWDWGSPGMINTLSGIGETHAKPHAARVIAEPNPFNAVCKISICSETHTTARISNIAGKIVASWNIVPGENVLAWQADNMPSGVYIISAGGAGNISIPVMLIR